MSRPVRVAATVNDDVATQLDSLRSAEFWRRDLPAAVELLTIDDTWESLPVHGGGKRMTLEGLSVGAFHVFAALDELDARPGALVIYTVDIWPDGFPEA